MKTQVTIFSKNGTKYQLELSTLTVDTHSLMSDYPEIWATIREQIWHELEILVKLHDMAR